MGISSFNKKMKLFSFFSLFTVELFAAKSNEIFVFSEEALTRENARQQCEDGLSQLVSFNNFVEFHQFKNLLKKKNIEEDIWIGISKENGAWTNPSNSESFFKKWLNGEPSTTDSCAKLSYGNSWMMKSAPCSEKFKEREAHGAGERNHKRAARRAGR